MFFLKNFKKEKDTKRKLEIIRNAKKNYQENIVRLNKMSSLLYTINKNSDILGKIKEAKDSCNDCIRRMDAVINSLENHDYKHIDNQIEYLIVVTNKQGQLSQEINEAIQQKRF